MVEATTLARSVLADEVKDRLLQDILTGRYPPDARIVETSVARELGVSQAPVREALRALEATGIVEILPFRGARVRRPTTEELGDAMMVRAELEMLAARLAIPRMTDDDVADVLKRGDDLRRAASDGDPHTLAMADTRFHATIVGLSGNATLERLWRALEPFPRTYITSAIPGVDVDWTAALHWPILDAVERRDAAAAVDSLREHFDSVAAKIESGGWQALDTGASAPPATDQAEDQSNAET